VPDGAEDSHLFSFGNFRCLAMVPTSEEPLAEERGWRKGISNLVIDRPHGAPLGIKYAHRVSALANILSRRSALRPEGLPICLASADTLWGVFDNPAGRRAACR